MIRSFADKLTEQVWDREHVRKLHPDVQRAAHRKLKQLDVVDALGELAVPPGNRLEPLQGNRIGQHRIALMTSGASALRGRMPDRKELRSLTTTKAHEPIHPGEILREEFLVPMELSAYALAKAIDVPESRLSAILNGRRAVTADTGLRLSRYFGLGDHYWTRLQESYDVEVTRDALHEQLAGIAPRH